MPYVVLRPFAYSSNGLEPVARESGTEVSVRPEHAAGLIEAGLIKSTKHIDEAPEKAIAPEPEVGPVIEDEQSLADQYKARFGKQPHWSWNDDKIREKLDEAGE